MKTSFPIQKRLINFAIWARFKGRSFGATESKNVCYRQARTAHPYYIRGIDLEVFNRKRIVAVHLPESSSLKQAFFDFALTFFASSVRNQLFHSTYLEQSRYVTSLPLEDPGQVILNGHRFTYNQYSSQSQWRESLSQNGHTIARSTGPIIHSFSN